MKKYNVTILLVVNPSRDVELETPETKQVEFEVMANSEREAIEEAKKLETSSLSVWETYAEEIED
jgi:hypothetical protein